MDMDMFYSYKSSLQNLKLLKLLHDKGVNVKDFPDFFNDINYHSGADWDIFLKGIQSVFMCVDWYYPYDEEVKSDKLYWFKQAGLTLDNIDDSEGIIVILDDRIKDVVPSNCLYGGSTYDYFYYGYAETHSIENGVLIHFNEDDGQIDLVEVLWYLLKEIKLEDEVEKNEMAV